MALHVFFLLVAAMASGKTKTSEKKETNQINHEGLTVLTDNNFYDITEAHAKSPHQWLILFHEGPCTDCQALLEAWNSAKEDLEAESVSLRIASFDVSKSRVLAERMELDKFPSIVFIRRRRFYMYNTEIHPQALKIFILERGYKGQGRKKVPEPVTLVSRVKDFIKYISIQGPREHPYIFIGGFATFIISVIAAAWLCTDEPKEKDE